MNAQMVFNTHKLGRRSMRAFAVVAAAAG